jgi:hypothetical protein
LKDAASFPPVGEVPGVVGSTVLPAQDVAAVVVEIACCGLLRVLPEQLSILVDEELATTA